MFKILCVLMLSFGMQVSAAPVFSAGNIKFTGDTYISTLSDTETKGIGRVTTITQGDSVLWSSGDSNNYINFVFGGFAPVVSPVAPIYNFQAAGGSVDFYLNDSTTFNTADSVSDASAAIQAGNLLLSTVASGPTIGIATNVTYSANGFLDVTGGLFSWLLDTNSRSTFNPDVLSDMTFGLVGAANQNANVSRDYQYIASADLQASTTVAAVPLPGTVLLMLTGLMGLLSVARRRNIV